MNAATKLVSYGALLALVLGGGAALGATVGPEPADSPTEAHGGGHSSDDAPSALPGLAVSDAGYTFVPETTVLQPGTNIFRFRIVDDAGETVTRFEVEHEKELHLIAVSRDLNHYAHVHPVRDDAGTWSVEIPDLQPGALSVFADFTPADGPSLTLGVDATVPGTYEAPAPSQPEVDARVDDFVVTLDADLHAGEVSTVVLRTSRDGRPAALEPYLGADGHLVAIRDGDLAYLHVHPEDGDGSAGEVAFGLEVPSAGRYHLFFDFQVDGVVRTASFVVDVVHRADGDGSGESDGHEAGS